MMTGFGWAMGLSGWLWMGIGIVLLVVVVWVLVAAIDGRDRHSVDRAATILRERFARGEITEAEYEHAKKLLGG